MSDRLRRRPSFFTFSCIFPCCGFLLSETEEALSALHSLLAIDLKKTASIRFVTNATKRQVRPDGV